MKANGLAIGVASLDMENQKILEKVGALAATSSNAGKLMRETASFPGRQHGHSNWGGTYLLETGELVLGRNVGKPTPPTRLPPQKGLSAPPPSRCETLI